MPNQTKADRPRPRIGIDLHVADGIFQGSRTHCLELFSRVISLTPDCDFVALVGDPRNLLSFSDSFSLPNVTLFPMPKRPAPFRVSWQLPQIVRRCGLALLHTQYIAPPILACPAAVTVHDILFETHPEYFEKSFIVRSRLLVPLSVRKSAFVFTVSEFSRGEICNAYSVSPTRVHTIPNGVDVSRFFPGSAGFETVRRLGFEAGSYFLTVGRLEPRKNHPALLRAWAQLRTPRPPLVIVGQRHFQYHEVFDLIRTLHLEDDVKVIENISDLDLPAVYRNAKAFVFTSWAEGFGMPLLEAMASGVPVVTCANTAQAEVSGDAAIHVDPDQPAEIANAISALAQDAGLRELLIRRGLTRAGEFTWEKAARTVRDVYRRHFGLADAPQPIDALV